MSESEADHQPNWFRLKRAEASLTAKQLSERLGTHLNTVYAWEQDHAVPRPAMWAAIGRVFNVTAGEVGKQVAAQKARMLTASGHAN